jgi:enamine deaminase RidA (YjgF/YER057c/UK114 family)
MAMPHASHATIAGDTAYVSGVLGVIQGSVVPGGTLAELDQAFRNLEKVFAKLREHGFAGFRHAVMVRIFLRDMGYYAAVNERYMQLVPSPRPARLCIEVGVPRKGDFEIEVTLYKGGTIIYIENLD